MMLLIILSTLFSFQILAQEFDCANEILNDEMFREIAIPNCTKEQIISDAKNGETSNFCNKCKNDFQKKTTINIPLMDINTKKKKFLEAAFNEYQKNLTDNILQTLKLRALRPTGSSYSNSSKACALKSSKDFGSKCSKESLDLLDGHIKKFQSSISTEMAKILSTDGNYNPSGTLLKRANSSCFIPEKDILYINANALEEVLDQNTINIISSLDSDNYSSFEELFLDEKILELNDSLFELIDPIKSHPLLSEYAKDPGSLIDFFKSVKDPKDLTELRNKLYSKSTGDDFDNRLAQSCMDSFNALSDAICSDEFNRGDISIEGFKNYNQLFNKSIDTDSSDFAHSEDLMKKNVHLLSLCEISSPSYKKLSIVNNAISKNLDPKFTSLSLDQYLSDKYEKDISQANDKLCNDLSACNENSFHCKVIDNYKRLQNKSSIESKLANSSNTEINTLLRSMLGDEAKIDLKTRQVLIAQGILPKADGTLVEQPDIPERRVDFIQKSAPTVSSMTKASAMAARTQTEQRTAGNQEPTHQRYVNPLKSSDAADFDMPDFSDLFSGSDAELKEIQNEIRRRLMELPEKKPSTISQAREISRSSFENTGRKITPFQESRFAARMMQPQLHHGNSGEGIAPNKAAVSETETAAEKWKNGQMDKALAEMAGAQQALNRNTAGGTASASSNSESKAKELSKVALNISDDPKVTLSELFSSKYHNNDSETQLLRVLMASKSNFLLQVKNARFKVVFDGKTGYNLLFDSGNQQEAEKLRPQLEIFLKRLRK